VGTRQRGTRDQVKGARERPKRHEQIFWRVR
jgi:hypothetical protein